MAPVRRPQRCQHLGKVLDRKGTNCSRCWDYRCDLLGKAVQIKEACQTCDYYATEEQDVDVQKLILSSTLSPGDIVVMTAAVAQLHKSYPGKYLTDVRTPVPALWENNPHVTRIEESDKEARKIDLHYPLIHQSNQRPVHFLEGYMAYLGDQLGISLRPSVFRGDVHLSDQERGWMNQVEETSGHRGPFWLVNAGGKSDFTCKIWPQENFQRVVDHFQGRVQFVQIGAREHGHPALENVIDMRGRTDHRQLIRLVYHCAGIMTGVSYPMHLAAAVPLPPGRKGLRPCVVIAGGREPDHWEQYPGHRYLSTVGALSCCGFGGCWKSRTVPLGDGDTKDQSLCEQPIEGAPRCMRMITPEMVIAPIDNYFCGNL